jgi:PadR family transcriptional regulator, regulatory protein AphA
MSLEHAILGFLSYRPFSGYDLKKIFDTSVRHFWYADQSQIYRTLAHMTEQGLTEIEVVEQSDRPDRKLYHITPAGLQELRSWLLGPFPVDQAHSGPLIQVFFSGKLSDEEALVKFQEAAAIFRGVLEMYTAVPVAVEEYTKIVGSAREAYFWTSTLDLGIETMKTQLAWAERIIQDILNKKIPAA